MRRSGPNNPTTTTKLEDEMPTTAGKNLDQWSHPVLKTSLIKARDIKIGDLLEHPNLQVFREVRAIDKQFGRLYFLFGDSQPRTCLVDDLVMVGRIGQDSGKATCKICKFSAPVQFSDRIECHRHSPSPFIGEHNYSGASWPALQRDLCCGDWELGRVGE
jgi:hypothetical protein